MSTWTTISQVRKVAEITTADFTDSEIAEFINLAQKEVSSKLVSKVNREPIYFIDSFRDNARDGVNSTYYVRNWFGNYLADYNYDNEVNTTDVTLVQYDTNTQLESKLTISSIDIPNCSFTLSSPPTSNVQLYVTYAYSPIDPVNPDPFVALCVAYLAGSYLFIGSDGFKLQFGNVRIEPGLTGGKGKQLHDKYQDVLQQLIVNSTGGSLWSDMAVRI